MSAEKGNLSRFIYMVLKLVSLIKSLLKTISESIEVLVMNYP